MVRKRKSKTRAPDQIMHLTRVLYPQIDSFVPNSDCESDVVVQLNETFRFDKNELNGSFDCLDELLIVLVVIVYHL